MEPALDPFGYTTRIKVLLTDNPEVVQRALERSSDLKAVLKQLHLEVEAGSSFWVNPPGQSSD
jgi:hypothetical protein